MSTESEFVFPADERAERQRSKRRRQLESEFEPELEFEFERRAPEEFPLPEPDSPGETVRQSDPFEPIKRLWAGVGAVVVGMFAGIVQSNSGMVMTVQTPAGEAIVMNSPDAAFLWSLVLLGVAIALVIYAAGGRQ